MAIAGPLAYISGMTTTRLTKHPAKFQTRKTTARRPLHASPPAGMSAEEQEASAILDRIERELPEVEARTERLMRLYGL